MCQLRRAAQGCYSVCSPALQPCQGAAGQHELPSCLSPPIVFFHCPLPAKVLHRPPFAPPQRPPPAQGRLTARTAGPGRALLLQQLCPRVPGRRRPPRPRVRQSRQRGGRCRRRGKTRHRPAPLGRFPPVTLPPPRPPRAAGWCRPSSPSPAAKMVVKLEGLPAPKMAARRPRPGAPAGRRLPLGALPAAKG